jgi:hypothetical protein
MAGCRVGVVRKVIDLILCCRSGSSRSRVWFVELVWFCVSCCGFFLDWQFRTASGLVVTFIIEHEVGFVTDFQLCTMPQALRIIVTLGGLLVFHLLPHASLVVSNFHWLAA